MRVSIVPAQITTVEDKIAGNVSVQQAMLLGLPILFGFVTALFFPPFGQFVAYKVAIVIILFVLCGSLALRIEGRIIAQWIKLFAIYSARPKYYVYDKNTSYLRVAASAATHIEAKAATTIPQKKITPQISHITPHEFARLEQFATDNRAGIKFVVGKKGELNVHITEVE